MRRSVLIPLVLVSIVVFLSGCTIVPGVGPSGRAVGVVIKSFGPFIPEVYSGDTAIFSLSVENVGDEDADNVQAKLFGLGTNWDWTPSGYSDVNPPSLVKSDPDLKILGGIGDKEWNADSPVLRVDNTYTAGVRVKYHYTTSAHADIRAYDRDYLRTRPEEASSIMKQSGVESFTVSKSPIKVSISGLARPLVTEGGSTTIAILIENVGQGTPFLEECDLGDAEQCETKPQLIVDSIIVNAGTDEAKQCVTDLTKTMPRGGRGSVSCQFDIPSFEDFTTIPIDIQLSYNYFVDSSATIKVLKSLDTGDSSTVNGGNGEGIQIVTGPGG